MKKILCLPLFAVAILVSQVGAEHCTYNGSPAYCEWAGPKCHSVNNTYSPNIGTSCETLIANCVKDGSLFTNVSETNFNESNGYGEGLKCKSEGGTWTGQGKDPDAVSLGYCNWGNCDCVGDYSCAEGGGCFEISSQADYDECNLYGQIVANASACPVASRPKADGGTCPTGGTNPIRADVYSVANLTVLVQAGSLHISSAKEANVSLYSMSGKQVFSQNISAGYETVSLNNQKQGVYFAVVSSGSSKQTVRIVLK